MTEKLKKCPICGKIDTLFVGTDKELEGKKEDEYNSEDYAAELKKKMKVVEMIEEDGEMTDFECADYYENQDEDAQD
ncbi:MAG TPA: hypothetical protein DCM73_12475 [Clostridiales bacterium]|nr:hypothetical protein [Clostridiales bacterium]